MNLRSTRFPRSDYHTHFVLHRNLTAVLSKKNTEAIPKRVQFQLSNRQQRFKLLPKSNS
jgi:hypothetical protein